MELQGANPRDTNQEGRQVLHSTQPGLGGPFHCSFARDSMTQVYLGLPVLGSFSEHRTAPRAGTLSQILPLSSKTLVGGGAPRSVASKVASFI